MDERTHPKPGDNRTCTCGHAAGLHPMTVRDGERTRGECMTNRWHPAGDRHCTGYAPASRQHA